MHAPQLRSSLTRNLHPQYGFTSGEATYQLVKHNSKGKIYAIKDQTGILHTLYELPWKDAISKFEELRSQMGGTPLTQESVETTLSNLPLLQHLPEPTPRYCPPQGILGLLYLDESAQAWFRTHTMTLRMPSSLSLLLSALPVLSDNPVFPVFYLPQRDNIRPTLKFINPLPKGISGCTQALTVAGTPHSWGLPVPFEEQGLIFKKDKLKALLKIDHFDKLRQEYHLSAFDPLRNVWTVIGKAPHTNDLNHDPLTLPKEAYALVRYHAFNPKLAILRGASLLQIKDSPSDPHTDAAIWQLAPVRATQRAKKDTPSGRTIPSINDSNDLSQLF